jgi:hypothetical protein
MRRVSWLAFACALLTLASANAGDSSKHFFNGKDLTGWEGLEEYWTVKDGTLTGAHKGLSFNTFLCSKHKFSDFEMKFQVKLTGGGANSGIQIRSHIHDAKKFAVTGPQCDMGGPYWGSLYGENFGGMMKAADGKLVEKILKKDDFNDYYIKCVGQHVTIKLNGETTVDQDFDKAWAEGGKGRKELPADGIIAFQLHATGSPGMSAEFRHIQFKDLSKK